MTVFCFTACGSNAKEVTYDEAELEQVTEFLLDYCASADEATIQQWNDMSEFAIELQLTQAGLPFDSESFLGVLESWQAGVKDCGSYQGHGDYSYKVTNSSVEVSTPAQFEKRDATISFSFDKDSKLESMTINAQMSTGEILEKAGLNTLLGMGTVFVVLILIAFIISLFKYIPAIQEAFSKKKKKDSAETKNAPVTPVVVSKAATSDDEIIAVIAAAIAAAEADAGNASTDGFVVRSIRRRPSNKWNSR